MWAADLPVCPSTLSFPRRREAIRSYVLGSYGRSRGLLTYRSFRNVSTASFVLCIIVSFVQSS